MRRGWDAWVRGDLDALLELCDPAVEWDTTHMEGLPEDAVYFGRDGVRRFLEEWLGSWERFESGAERILETGGDRVVVICWQQGFGPGSEVPVHMDWAQICTLQRGLVCRVEAYSDRAQALEAAGLREEAVSQENIEIVRRAFDNLNAFLRGELTNEALSELIDPQIGWDWHDLPPLPDAPRDLRGAQEFIGFLDQFRSEWVDLAAEPLELIEASDDRVLVCGRLSGRGRESGVAIEAHPFQLLTIRDGKVRKMDSFRHRADAVEAAGLSEQSPQGGENPEPPCLAV